MTSQDELSCFSAGAITADFCATRETHTVAIWELHVEAGVWPRYTGKSPLLEAV